MLYNVSVYNKESLYIYGSNYFLTITKICYAQTHMRGKASHPSFLFYINILSPLPYQAFVILQASLPLLYPLTCHNRCLILMFSNVACEPLYTFSHFSHYPFLMLMFHYSYLQYRDVYISLVFSVSHNSYSIRLVNTYFLDSQCYPHHKSHLLCCKAIAALSTQYSPPSPIQSHLSKLENFHLPP